MVYGNRLHGVIKFEVFYKYDLGQLMQENCSENK